jgi:hypothetical protein
LSKVKSDCVKRKYELKGVSQEELSKLMKFCDTDQHKGEYGNIALE